MNHDIFLSYASSDAEQAEQIAHFLEQAGLSVWWDRDIPPGKTWDQVLGEALSKARCVVVLWTKNSVASDWVKDEAARGRQRNILIPVLLEDVEIPLGFGRIEAADLRNWNNTPSDREFANFVSAIQTLVDAPTPAHTGLVEPKRQKSTRKQSAHAVPKRFSIGWGIAITVAILIGSAALYMLYPQLGIESGTLNVELWRVEGDRKTQLLASQAFDEPDELAKVGDWLTTHLYKGVQTKPEPIRVELQLPANLATTDIQVKTTPAMVLETYIYVVSGQDKTRIKSPLTRERLALLEEDFFIEFRHSGYQSHALKVVLGNMIEKSFTLIPKQLSVAIEQFEGMENRIGQKLAQLLVQDDRLRITTPDALERVRAEIREANAAVGANRTVQTAIRDSLGVDFIVAGAVEN